MQELLRTNDPILISFVQSMLHDEEIDSVVFDSHIANLEGGVSAFQCRLMVIDDADANRARTILAEAELDR